MRKKVYDFEPTTIGEHVKKKRLELGLTQKQIAKWFFVTPESVGNWEAGDNQPDKPRVLRRIIRFLGYDPFPKGTTIPDLLRAKRRELGMGQRELAKHLGVDPWTIYCWEQDGTIGYKRHRVIVAKFLGIPEQDLHETMGHRWKTMTRAIVRSPWEEPPQNRAAMPASGRKEGNKRGL